MISIALYEGFRSEPYLDSVGVPTDGFGNTEGVEMGTPVSVPRALMKLGQHVNKFEKAMKRCIGDVPLYQHEWDAYVSLTYNIGSGAFCRSTLVKKLKQRDYEGACKQILRWNRAGGRILPGLVKRRQKEFRTCMGVEQ
jgi:lysozyme